VRHPWRIARIPATLRAEVLLLLFHLNVPGALTARTTARPTTRRGSWGFPQPLRPRPLAPSLTAITSPPSAYADELGLRWRLRHTTPSHRVWPDAVAQSHSPRRSRSGRSGASSVIATPCPFTIPPPRVRHSARCSTTSAAASQHLRHGRRRWARITSRFRSTRPPPGKNNREALDLIVSLDRPAAFEWNSKHYFTAHGQSCLAVQSSAPADLIPGVRQQETTRLVGPAPLLLHGRAVLHRSTSSAPASLFTVSARRARGPAYTAEPNRWLGQPGQRSPSPTGRLGKSSSHTSVLRKNLPQEHRPRARLDTRPLTRRSARSSNRNNSLSRSRTWDEIENGVFAIVEAPSPFAKAPNFTAELERGRGATGCQVGSFVASNELARKSLTLLASAVSCLSLRGEKKAATETGSIRKTTRGIIVGEAMGVILSYLLVLFRDFISSPCTLLVIPRFPFSRFDRSPPVYPWL